MNTTTRNRPDGVLPNSFHRFSRLTVLAGINNIRAARNLFDFNKRDIVAQDMIHVGLVPIEALDLVQHNLSIYDPCIYEQTGDSSTSHDFANIAWRPSSHS